MLRRHSISKCSLLTTNADFLADYIKAHSSVTTVVKSKTLVSGFIILIYQNLQKQWCYPTSSCLKWNHIIWNFLVVITRMTVYYYKKLWKNGWNDCSRVGCYFRYKQVTTKYAITKQNHTFLDLFLFLSCKFLLRNLFMYCSICKILLRYYQFVLWAPRHR